MDWMKVIHHSDGFGTSKPFEGLHPGAHPDPALAVMGVELSAPAILEDEGEVTAVIAEAVAGPRAKWKRIDQLAPGGISKM